MTLEVTQPFWPQAHPLGVPWAESSSRVKQVHFCGLWSLLCWSTKGPAGGAQETAPLENP